jgi:hypothetical protein
MFCSCLQFLFSLFYTEFGFLFVFVFMFVLNDMSRQGMERWKTLAW